MNKLLEICLLCFEKLVSLLNKLVSFAIWLCLNVRHDFIRWFINAFEYEVVELEQLNIERIIKLVGVYNMHTRKIEWIPKEYMEERHERKH